MIKKKKVTKKDRYGQLVDEADFDKYWDNYHSLEDLSMKESVRQKKERLAKIQSKE